jgi:spore germination cell wall hydrolase CwlJ-like protein
MAETRGRPKKATIPPATTATATAHEKYEAKETIFHALNDTQLMALTMWAEARGESREGRIGVGSTILERVDHREWDGKTIREVCLWPYQFSCYLSNDPNYPHLVNISNDFDAALQRFAALRECYDIADGMITGRIARNTTAMQYLNPQVAGETKKKWLASGMKSVLIIGRHEWFE